MKVDFDERKPMEVEAIYGNPVRAVRRAGGAMPLVEMLYCQLKFLDARNLTGAERPAVAVEKPR
jgi:2-dehydropantoate 2-reductase